MVKSGFYDGTKLLSLTDIDGNKPEIFICTSNRSAGKTTYYSRYLVKRFLKHDEKFLLLYRFVYEMDGVADKFFKDIQALFFPEYVMTTKRDKSGAFYHLFLLSKDKEPIECGYACALNNADQLKKCSHLLSDVTRIFFDEFQSESNHYCDNEIVKFQSIHTTVSRGKGEFVRYVPVIMCSNPVSIINPYYTSMNIFERLKPDTKFLRGQGWVLEQGYNEGASQAQLSSGFNKAFSNSDYHEFSISGKYLNDNLAFIEKPTGKSKYIATVRYEGVDYGIREFPETGIIYCDNHADKTFNTRIALTTDDHNINYVMLKNNEYLIINLRWYFERGCFRFKDLKCKECILKLLSY